MVEDDDTDKIMTMMMIELIYLENPEDDEDEDYEDDDVEYDDDDDEMIHLENPEDAHHPDQPDHLPCSPNHLSIIIIFGRYDDLTII